MNRSRSVVRARMCACSGATSRGGVSTPHISRKRRLNATTFSPSTATMPSPVDSSVAARSASRRARCASSSARLVRLARNAASRWADVVQSRRSPMCSLHTTPTRRPPVRSGASSIAPMLSGLR
jgi:hypothetical protein